MIITRTPFRISFFGGGTDYPVYYREHGGAVLSTTLNKYCYITCRHLPPFFDHRYSIRYSKTELPNEIGEIIHPSVRECLNFLGIERGIEMVHAADVPACSGIGSSSAFTVGFLNALYGLQGKMITKRKLAADAIHVEQNLIGEAVGSQDQVAAAFGGLNKIEFGTGDRLFVQPLTVLQETIEQLQASLLFYFSGFSRVASEIAKEQIKATPKKLCELSMMRDMVDEGVNILNRGPATLDDFGTLLHESWKLKRSLTSRISISLTDEIYDAARAAGAIGGKVCGAGGGGFMILYVRPENQPKVKEALKNLLLVPFRFETLGSHLVHYSDSDV